MLPPEYHARACRLFRLAAARLQQADAKQQKEERQEANGQKLPTSTSKTTNEYGVGENPHPPC